MHSSRLYAYNDLLNIVKSDTWPVLLHFDFVGLYSMEKALERIATQLCMLASRQVVTPS